MRARAFRPGRPNPHLRALAALKLQHYGVFAKYKIFIALIFSTMQTEKLWKTLKMSVVAPLIDRAREEYRCRYVESKTNF